jgi:hypothetical protein
MHVVARFIVLTPCDTAVWDVFADYVFRVPVVMGDDIEVAGFPIFPLHHIPFFVQVLAGALLGCVTAYFLYMIFPEYTMPVLRP